MFQLGDALAESLLLVVLDLALERGDFRAGLVGLAAHFLLGVALRLTDLFDEVQEEFGLARLNVHADFALSLAARERVGVEILTELSDLKRAEILGTVDLTGKLAACAVELVGERVTGALSSRDTVERVAAVVVITAMAMTAMVTISLAGSDRGDGRESHAVVIVAAVAAEAPESDTAGAEEPFCVSADGHILWVYRCARNCARTAHPRKTMQGRCPRQTYGLARFTSPSPSGALAQTFSDFRLDARGLCLIVSTSLLESGPRNPLRWILACL